MTKKMSTAITFYRSRWNLMMMLLSVEAFTTVQNRRPCFGNNPQRRLCFEARLQRQTCQTSLFSTLPKGNDAPSASLLKQNNSNRSPLNPLLDQIQPSQTVEIFSRVKDLRANGFDVTGGLCVGEPDFGPPMQVIEATIAALNRGDTKYTAVTGTAELRRAISQDLATRKGLQYNPNTEIVVANGAKQAVYQGILAVVGLGDQVLVPAPYWPSYPEMALLAGAEPVFLETLAESGYLMKAEQLRQALEQNTRVKLVILCNPSNPTGGVYSKQALEELVAVLHDFPDVFVLADEIYDQLVYGDEEGEANGIEKKSASQICPSIASLPGMWNRTLTINGFSKSYAMTGYRLGYLAAPSYIARACSTLQSQFTSCASSLAQAAGLAALTQVPNSWIADKVSELRSKRDRCLSHLAKMTHATVRVPPKGAFYVLVDISTSPWGTKDVEFCQDLLQQQKLALVPGSSFGAPGTVRISYATSMEELDVAMKKLAAFLESPGREN